MFSEYRTILVECYDDDFHETTQLFSGARFIAEARIIATIFPGSQHPYKEGKDRDFSPAY